MHLITTTSILAALSLTITAQQSFHIYPFGAQDGYTGVHDDPTNPWSESHDVWFNISRPGAVSEQGGDAEYSCTIGGWDGCDPLTCYTPCEGVGGAQYYARVTPGVKGMISANISIDILEYYSYRNSVLQNATFTLQEGVEVPGCYRCDPTAWRRGYSTDWCSLKNETGLDVPMEVFGYGIYPVSDVVGICEYDRSFGWFDPRDK